MIAPDTAPRAVELCASASAKGRVIAMPSKSSKNTIRRIGSLLIMLDVPIRAFRFALLANWRNSMKRHCDSAALQCFLFEFHFIRVAIAAQEKPTAILTCLLNMSSALILVVMQSLTTRL
jgi:hypothetical protein